MASPARWSMASRQGRPQVNLLLNHGGNQAWFYKTVADVIPTGAVLRYGRPVGHEDGSLEFPALEGVGEPVGEPEEIYGYERDGENRRLFRPIWPDCIERALGVFVRDELLVVAGRCNCHRAEHFNKPVTMDQCRECPARTANHVPEPLPTTAEEIKAAAEARAAESAEKRLGADMFERAEEKSASMV